MKNLSQGPILKGILLFALPLLLGNFFQMLYTTVDALIVGKNIGSVAVGAIGATGSVSGLIISSGQGITAGMALLTARYFGAKKLYKVQQSFTIGLLFTVGISVLFSILALIFVDPLLQIMQTPSSIFALSRTFMSTIFFGMIFTNLYNYLSASIRALGNSRISLYALLVSNIFNASFSAILVIGLHLGVLGAGLATIMAQAVSVIFLVFYIRLRMPQFRFRPVKFEKADLIEHLRIGLPMGLQASVISLGSIIQQIAINKMGTIAIIAQTIAIRYDGFAGMVTVSLGIAMATFAAQNLGAEEYQRITKGLKATLILAISYSLAFAAILFTFNRFFTGLFMNAASDPKIYQMALLYYLANGSLYWLLGILFVTRYTLQGLGEVKAPTMAGTMELVFRSIFAIIGVLLGNVFLVFFSEGIAWIGSTGILIPATLRMVKRFRKFV